MELAKRLNPNHPVWYAWHHGAALYGARRYEEAVDVLRSAVSHTPSMASGLTDEASSRGYFNRPTFTGKARGGLAFVVPAISERRQRHLVSIAARCVWFVVVHTGLDMLAERCAQEPEELSAVFGAIDDVEVVGDEVVRADSSLR